MFTANAAVVRRKKAYIANFFYPERKGEQYFYNKWFKENGYETDTNKDIPFEGGLFFIINIFTLFYIFTFFILLYVIIKRRVQFNNKNKFMFIKK